MEEELEILKTIVLFAYVVKDLKKKLEKFYSIKTNLLMLIEIHICEFWENSLVFKIIF